MPRKVCLHCMFLRSVKYKYPKWAKSGMNPHKHDDAVNRDMFITLARLTSDFLRDKPDEDRAKFVAIIQAKPPTMQEFFQTILEGHGQTKQ